MAISIAFGRRASHAVSVDIALLPLFYSLSHSSCRHGFVEGICLRTYLLGLRPPGLERQIGAGRGFGRVSGWRLKPSRPGVVYDITS